jgi:hypothetical protein
LDRLFHYVGMGRARKVPYSKGMWPDVAAFQAIVCALSLLLVGGARAHADRRPVAVVDLANEPATRELAAELATALDGHPELRKLPSSIDDAALVGEIEDSDAPILSRAVKDKALAEAQIQQFDYALALTYAREGQRELLSVTPSLAVKTYADLAFVAGVALVSDQLTADAEVEFLLSYRLDPRTLDPRQFTPAVVQAYADAKAGPSVAGSIDIKGTGSVWIDGTEVGTAPRTFLASAGRHVVWLTAIDRVTVGTQIDVLPGTPTAVVLEQMEAPRRTKVQRARQVLARVPDASAKSAAMKRLADLIGVKDAVLLSMTNGKVIVQTWHDGTVRAPGFSAFRERGKATADELLLTLAPPKVVKEPELPPIPRPLVTKSWYERRPYQFGIAVGIAAAIVSGVLWATRGPGTFGGFNPDVGVEPPGMARR